MQDFELTPDEKKQIISQRIREFKARRYNSQINLQLAEMLDDAEPSKEQQVEEFKKEIKAVEKLIHDLLTIDDDVDKEIIDNGVDELAKPNGNRATKRTKESQKLG